MCEHLCWEHDDILTRYWSIDGHQLNDLTLFKKLAGPKKLVFNDLCVTLYETYIPAWHLNELAGADGTFYRQLPLQARASLSKETPPPASIAHSKGESHQFAPSPSTMYSMRWILRMEEETWLKWRKAALLTEWLTQLNHADVAGQNRNVNHCSIC